jgi:hypothetical protein
VLDAWASSPALRTPLLRLWSVADVHTRRPRKQARAREDYSRGPSNIRPERQLVMRNRTTLMTM